MDAEPARPDWAGQRLAEFERHLAAERGLSPHTVRAYLGDVRALLEHACRDGLDDLSGLGITIIRSWLADQHASGMARASLARRAAAARAFTAYGHARGWLASDPGPLLGTPKAARPLPDVLRQEQMEAVLAAAPAPEPADDPHAASLAWRDTAIMELLYASGIRVSELCGLDLGDLDDGRRTVRVLGKGSKERVVPVGQPAVRAVQRWRDAGRLCWSASAPGPRSIWARGAGAWIPGPHAGSCTPGSRRPDPSPTPARTGCVIPRPRICSRGARTCAACRRSSATRRSRPPRSTPMYRSSGCCPPTARRIRGRNPGHSGMAGRSLSQLPRAAAM